MWGQGARCLNQCSNCRIIPTRVGTSPVGAITSLAGKDHPHACGDKELRRKLKPHLLGSSPRVWGQAALINRIAEVKGIIPTRVGTRLMYITLSYGEKDHPHACGDKYVEHGDKNPQLGSSPRVWGQGQNVLRSLSGGRIIPTRVGTSKDLYSFIASL